MKAGLVNNYCQLKYVCIFQVLLMRHIIDKHVSRKREFIASEQNQYKINMMTARITPKKGNNPASNRLPYHMVF